MNRAFYYSFFVILSSLIFTSSSLAAQIEDLTNVRISNISAQNITPNEKARMVGLNTNDELRVIRSRVDARNNRHTRYQQYHRGIPVWGRHVIENAARSQLTSRLSGKIVKAIDQDIVNYTPGHTADDVLRKAKELFLLSATGNRDWTFKNEKSDLSIYVDENNTARLVYIVSFFVDLRAQGEPAIPSYIIDASSMLVLKKWNNLQYINIGTGPGGNVKTGVYEYGQDFPYLDVITDAGSTICTTENSNVKTVNLNNDTVFTNIAYQYDCPRNTFQSINGAFAPINDAHYFGGVVYSLFQDWYNLPPLTFQLVMNVHYGVGFENAFFDGSSMTFGDGDTIFYPLVSLDVVAHEIAHGFTNQNSNLIYMGQSGGMNEAFSDMTGEVAEYYSRSANDWLLGADIFKQPDSALRYMQNPPQDGVSIDHIDDYHDGIDVHYSSGIYNKAFYLLATTPGWNIRQAFDVMVKANQDYWQPDSTFDEGVCGVMNAAVDLGYNMEDVLIAFSYVGVTCSTAPVNMISGVVTDIQGMPLRDVIIQLADPGGNIWKAKSMKDGSYRIVGILDGSYDFTPGKAGYILSSSSIEFNGQDVILDLVAQEAPGNTLSGWFTSDFGYPLDEVEVLISDGIGNQFSTFTDSKGYYRQPGIPDGSYTISGDKPGYSIAPHIVVLQNTDSTENLTGTPLSNVISGIVTNPDNEPVPGVLISTADNSGNVWRATTTVNGYYEQAGIPVSWYYMTTSKSGYDVPDRFIQSLTSDLVIDLIGTPRANVVSGRITNNNNAPLPGLTVRILDNSGFEATTVSNVNGYYEFGEIADGTYYVAVRTPPEGLQSPTPYQIVTVNGANVTADFVFKPYNSISGTITTTGGQPLNNVNITIADNSGNVWTVVTDGNGYYQQNGIPDGWYYMTTTKAGYNVPDRFIQSLSSDLVVDLVATASASTVSGIISQVDGTPLAGLSVRLLGQSGVDVFTQSNVNGFYEFAGIADGDYYVAVATPPADLQTPTPYQLVQISGANATADFIYKPYNTISGTVSTSNGDPLQGVSITIADNSGNVWTVLTDANGYYEQGNIPDGWYYMTNTKAGYDVPDKFVQALSSDMVFDFVATPLVSLDKMFFNDIQAERSNQFILFDRT